MAIKAFTALTGVVPVKAGVWLPKTSVLGASPDGLVGDDSVLECKCPYTHRNETILEAVKVKDLCLESKYGQYALKTSHVYDSAYLEAPYCLQATKTISVLVYNHYQ